MVLISRLPNIYLEGERQEIIHFVFRGVSQFKFIILGGFLVQKEGKIINVYSINTENVEGLVVKNL